MDPLAMRVAARFLVARPIWQDKHAISTFVDQQLQPEVVTWLRHQPADTPLGAAKGIARASLPVEAADGRSTMDVTVEVESRPAKGKWAAVLAGSFRRSSLTVTLVLNGALTPAEFLAPGRLQPLHACTYETCLAYGLYTLLRHELTHAADIFGAKPSYYRHGPDGEVEIDNDKYMNDPGEIRAFMQEVVDDVVRSAKKLREVSTQKPSPNQWLVDTCLKLSTTWSIIEPSLNPANRKRILKAVYDGLDRAGMLTA